MQLVSELTGAELDYWVARAAGLSNAKLRRVGPTENGGFVFVEHVQADGNTLYSPSRDWKHGGPIIERERIQLWDCGDWMAKVNKTAGNSGAGPTPLIAAMRAYVASKYGETVPPEAQEPAP